MAIAIQGIMKIKVKLTPSNYTPKQKCNIYRKELMRLERKDTSEYSLEEREKIVAKMEYYFYLLEVYSMESQEEWLYLPTKKVKYTNIHNLIYFENLYGNSIYEEKKYEEKEEER
jgi:hypothetical protein